MTLLLSPDDGGFGGAARFEAPVAAGGGRFSDGRDRYNAHAQYTSAKEAAAARISSELQNLSALSHLRVFDAGTGNGQVLAQVMRAAHGYFPTLPHFVAGKEISGDDVLHTLDRAAALLETHPKTVFALTNTFYSKAPWLLPNGTQNIVWKEVAIPGSTADDFRNEIGKLNNFISDHWKSHTTPSGNIVCDQPTVLVLFPENQKPYLNGVIPRQGAAKADYDLVIGAHAWRAAASIDSKVKNVISPLVKALNPRGRLALIQAAGNDDSQAIVDSVLPGQSVFPQPLEALGKAAQEMFPGNFTYRVDKAPVQYGLKPELDTRTQEGLQTAWDIAAYIAQMSDDDYQQATADRSGPQATRRQLTQTNGLLRFNDEASVFMRGPA